MPALGMLALGMLALGMLAFASVAQSAESTMEASPGQAAASAAAPSDGAPSDGPQSDAAAPPPPATVVPPAPPKPTGIRVSMQTSVGSMVFELDREHAPITVANFLRYVREKRFDGMTFYRAMNIAPGYGLIQGGTSNAVKRTLPPIKHEPTTQTGLSHVDGALSMARGAPGTAAGDFFITIGTLTALDANPNLAGDSSVDKLGYAVFGRVVEGMDTVQRILGAKISATKGAEAGMKGQMIDVPVKIIAAKIAPPKKPAPARAPAPGEQTVPTVPAAAPDAAVPSPAAP